MLADSEHLREHYALLSDAALLDVERANLVPAAQKLFDEELKRRALTGDEESGGEEETDPVNRRQPDGTYEAKPGWIDSAACACTFVPYPGNEAVEDAETAREILQTMGIPCYVDAHESEPEPQRATKRPDFEYRVLVPAKFRLQAESVLDAEIFNAAVEAEWKLYFKSLSDKELREVDSQLLFRGLLDRINRFTNSYRDEMAIRGLEPGLANHAGASG